MEYVFISLHGTEKINLNLTLEKKWFDMIVSKEKPEEYRKIKAYWFKRLVLMPEKLADFCGIKQLNDTNVALICNNPKVISMIAFKPFENIIFRNGYQKNAREIVFKSKGIIISTGNPKHGAVENEKYFVIRIGEELSRANF